MVSVVYVSVHISQLLKEELAWDLDMNSFGLLIIYFKVVIPLIN